MAREVCAWTTRRGMRSWLRVMTEMSDVRVRWVAAGRRRSGGVAPWGGGECCGGVGCCGFGCGFVGYVREQVLADMGVGVSECADRVVGGDDESSGSDAGVVDGELAPLSPGAKPHTFPNLSA